VAGGAEVIVTGDRDLLVLEWYNTIEILMPAMFAPRLTDER
jgi:predicted nucleic acid-binding protein